MDLNMLDLWAQLGGVYERRKLGRQGIRPLPTPRTILTVGSNLGIRSRLVSMCGTQ